MSAAYGTVCTVLLLLLSVTPCSAAGGWYLMYPPPDPPPKGNRSSIPLRDWIYWGSFDSASECEATRGFEIDVAERNVMSTAKNELKIENDPKFIASMRRHLEFLDVRLEQMRASLCVASDDRRLVDPRGPKGK